MQCCATMDGQAQTLLLTRVAKTTSTWRLSALPTVHSRTHGSVCSTLSNNSYSPFEIHIFCGNPTKELAKQPGSSPTCSDHGTNNIQFGLKAITSQIEKQPANHARSTTNVHRATHAENRAHCKTSNANLLRDSFNLLAQQRIRSSGLHSTIAGVQPSCITSSRSSTFPDSLRSAPLFSIQFAFDQSSTRFQISETRFQTHSLRFQTRSPSFQTQRDSASFGYLTPFDRPLDLWRSAFTGSIDSARSQPILLLLQLLRLLKAFQRSCSVCC